MANCSKCGSVIEPGDAFCASCGARTAEPPAAARSEGAVPASPPSLSFTRSHPVEPQPDPVVMNTTQDPSTSSGGATTVRQRLNSIPERTVFRWVLVSAAVLALGSIGTWATALGAISAGGLSGGGRYTLIVAIFVAVLMVDMDWRGHAKWLLQRRLGTMVVLAIVAVIICVLNLADIQKSGLGGVVTPGWGLYLATVAAISLVVGTWTVRAQHRLALRQAP